MYPSLRNHLAVASTMTVLLVPLLFAAPRTAEAQVGGRLQVMVPVMQPTDGTRARFGERVANNLRGDIDLDRHVSMSSRDMDRAAREYDMRANDLDCMEARQLAALLEVELVLCGDYAREGDLLRVNVVVWTVPGGDEYAIESFATRENDERGASRQIIEGFETLVRQVEYVGYCADFYASSNWESALSYCEQALELVPDSRSATIAMGGTLLELERFEEALDHFEAVLAEDEWNANVLVNAGYVASRLGQTDRARDYYTRYLAVNPGSTQVRMQVSYDLAQAGDIEGAMAFIAEGLEENPDDIALLEQYGSYAFRVAIERQAMSSPSQDGEMDPEVAELFRTAASTLMRVVDEEGEEANPSYVVNSVRAYIQLNDPAEAVRVAERGVQALPDAPSIWNEKGVAHHALGQTDEAVASLARVLELAPEFPTVRARMGNYLVQAGRVEEGIPHLREAIASGEQTPDQVANVIFADAVNNGIQKDPPDLSYGIRMLEMARSEFDMSTEFRQQVDFWLGYAVLQRAIPRNEPRNVQSAEATLPEFRRARELIQAGQPYLQRSPVIDYNNLMSNVNTFIEIQEAILARAGRR